MFDARRSVRNHASTHPFRPLEFDVRAMTGLLERPSTIRVLVADNHPAIRASIVGLIEAEDNMKIVAQAGDGRAAVEANRRLVQDVTLLDLRMTMLNGLGATVEIRARWPSARIVVLASHGDDMRATQAFGAGACGYLLKTTIRAGMHPGTPISRVEHHGFEVEPQN